MNEEKFTGKAELYQKFRPSYPKAMLDYLYSKVGFAEGSVIADIGAGTGIFTRRLLERGSFVYAVEPNGDMRAISQKELGAYPHFLSINAPAEHTGLKANSVDFVTVAQAFHWFDPKTFREECRRILSPGGKLVIVRNDEKEADEDTKMKTAQIEAFFSGVPCEHKIFENNLSESREAFIGRSLSSSHTPKEADGAERYADYVKELNGIFDAHSAGGLMFFEQITKCYVGEV